MNLTFNDAAVRRHLRLAKLLPVVRHAQKIGRNHPCPCIGSP